MKTYERKHIIINRQTQCDNPDVEAEFQKMADMYEEDSNEASRKLTSLLEPIMTLAIGLTKSYDPEIMKKVIELEDETDIYEDALGSYLVKLTGQQLSEHDNRLLNTLLYSLSDIERMADHAMAIAKAAREMEEKK